MTSSTTPLRCACWILVEVLEFLHFRSETFEAQQYPSILANMSANRNVESMINQGEFQPSVPRDEPLTTKGVC